jgi:hypothetical protein
MQTLYGFRNIKMLNESKWRTWKTQMIWNVPDLQEATRSEVMVGEARTAAFEDLATAAFAIHVEMQLISYESIAKR